MKKSVLFLMSAAFLLGSDVMADDQPQIPNGDFESWTFDGENLPDNWNSFQTFLVEHKNMITKGLIAAAGYDQNNRQVKRSTDVRPGSEGKYSCSIWARSAFGFVAQGNLTSGRVHAGDTNPTGAANYNFTDRSNVSTNGEKKNPFAMPFTGRPTAVKVWVKYVQGGSGYGDHATAKFSAIIHDDADYISYGLASNDTEANKALVVASAVKEIDYNGGEWEELTIPFEYTNNGAEPAYIQINASTNAYPGAGKVNDYLYIDDIEMVYEENNMKTFSEDQLYVSVTNYDDAGNPLPTTVNGPIDATVYVTEYDNNTIDFSLKNFKLSSDGYVGTVTVKNVPVTREGGITEFQDNQTVTIEPGDDPVDAFWLATLLPPVPLEMSGKYSNDHLYVTINIDLKDVMSMVVDVNLGEEKDVTGVTTMKAKIVKSQRGGVIYDLNGRKVSEMKPGRIYIVDGKKVVK